MSSIERAAVEKPRYDYIKCSINLDHDRAQEYADIWYDTFDMERGKDRAARHANVQSVRRNRDGTYLYAFEAWGETCGAVVTLDWERWSPHLHRMDVRGNMEITPGGIDRLYSYLTKHKSGAKNVALFSSRKRSKRQGRDTGGYGIAIGSHKSNLRTTFYVRGSEPGAFEFQCMGTLLEGAVNGVTHVGNGRAGVDDVRKWDALLMNLYIKGANDFHSVAGLDEQETQTLLAHSEPVGYEAEDAYHNAVAALSHLDRQQLIDITHYVQERLF